MLLHYSLRNKYFLKNQEKIKKEQEKINDGELTNDHSKETYSLFERLIFINLYSKKIPNKKINKPRPSNGVVLNEKVLIPVKALQQPISVLGSSGYGKTTTLIHFLKFAFLNNYPVIFIDGKGDRKLINELADIAKANRLKMKSWSIDGNLEKKTNEVKYNPFKNKTDNQIVALLLESQGYSQSAKNHSDSMYYRQIEKAILDLVVPSLTKLNIPIDLKSLSKYTNKKTFESLAFNRHNIFILDPLITEKYKKIKYFFDHKLSKIMAISLKERQIILKNKNFSFYPINKYEYLLPVLILSKLTKVHLSNQFLIYFSLIFVIPGENSSLLYTNYFTLLKNIYFENYHHENEAILQMKNMINQIERKQWLSLHLKLKSMAESLKTISANGIGLKDIINRKNNNNFIFFSIAMLEDSVNSKFVSDIIMLDIMQNASYNQTQGQTILLLDEYSAFGSSILSTLVLQARSLMYSLILSYQGISDIAKMGLEFKDIVLNNCNTFIVHKVQEPSGSTEISKLFGTKKNLVDTYQYKSKMNRELNLAGVDRTIDETYLFNPNVIQKLEPGNAIIKTITPDGKTYIHQEIQKIDFISPHVNMEIKKKKSSRKIIPAKPFILFWNFSKDADVNYKNMLAAFIRKISKNAT
ncbi:TraM recognition domain-containing protein [Mycoplasma amphoriforme]|uniref:TraM recognition domain-containing protein n=1 Tax=Mycoplasma amphoriforme TaxID=273136 RepID=UPI0031BB7FAF